MTAQKPYIDHRQIQAWRQESRHILPLEPFIPSNDGFVLGQDDRLVFRFMLNSLAAQYDKKGLTPEEAYAVMGRIENMPGIEQAAMDAQRDVVLLRKALSTLVASLATGGTPTQREIVGASMALRKTGGEA